MSPVGTSRPRTDGGVRLRVLVIGATGVFGGRVAELLVRDGRFAVLAGSRDTGRAQACAMALGAAQSVVVAMPDDPKAGVHAVVQPSVDARFDRIDLAAMVHRVVVARTHTEMVEGGIKHAHGLR